MSLYKRNLGYSEVGTSDSVITFEEPDLEINISDEYGAEVAPLIPPPLPTPSTLNSQFTYDEEAHDIPLDHFNILKLYHPRQNPIRVYQRIPNNTPCPNNFKSITNFAGVSETSENYWKSLDKSNLLLVYFTFAFIILIILVIFIVHSIYNPSF
jgi:hypothetical protein